MSTNADSSTHSSSASHGFYGYTPSEPWAIVFVVLFSICAVVHTIQATRSKYWVIYPTLVLGAVVELMGWAARLWSSINVSNLNPFLMQICLLIMAPVFFSAYCYAVLGTAIHRLGEQYSILRPNWYFIIFITADLVSLILQAIGGGQASASASKGIPTQSATNIMVAGIIFQLITMGIFIACGIDFCLRAQWGKPYAFQVRRIERRAAAAAATSSDKGVSQSALENTVSDETLAAAGSGTAPTAATTPDVEKQDSAFSTQGENMGRWWIMMLGVAISSAMIFIRGIYRSIELVQGWTGYLILREKYQIALDGWPMVIAVAVFIFINPLYVLPKKQKWGPYY